MWKMQPCGSLAILSVSFHILFLCSNQSFCIGYMCWATILNGSLRTELSLSSLKLHKAIDHFELILAITEIGDALILVSNISSIFWRLEQGDWTVSSWEDVSPLIKEASSVPKPGNTLRQKLVHPKDKILRHKQSNVVSAVQCIEECSNLYIGETEQPLHKRMAQHRRATSSG